MQGAQIHFKAGKNFCYNGTQTK
uniref:Uncharacterized protein n=1 Tax=Rhizophora mucronata TaxID=61149 RepID=A0A2P2PUM8_RHIMU